MRAVRHPVVISVKGNWSDEGPLESYWSFYGEVG